MIVLGGSASGEIGKNLAKILKARYSAVELKRFPDGEFAAKVPFNAYGEEVIIVQSTYAPQACNLIELLFMAEALRQMKAKKVVAVVPYLAYMRQNRSFTEGEAASAEVVMKMLNKARIDSLVTVQPHKEEPLSVFEGKSVAVKPVKALVTGIAGELSEPYVLAPDKGSLEMARATATLLGCEFTHLDKERDPVTGALSVKNLPAQRFDNKQVLIVDDVISTGGTIALSSKFAYSRGATEVVTAAVHLVMADGACNKMRQAGITRIYGTNTIPCGNATLIDISEEIAAALKKV